MEAHANKNGKNEKSKSGVIVKGIGDVAVKFSKCCSPVPGDEIIGFVTKGRGVTIHITDCINIINLTEDERHRLIETEWAENAKEENGDVSYLAEIRIIADERVNLIFDISRVISEESIPVKAFNGRTTKDLVAIFNVTIEITSKAQLEKISRRLKNIAGVRDIERVTT